MSEQRYITIRIPVIETGEHHTDVERKRRKMVEEIDELLDEVCRPHIDNADMMAEWFDVLQTMAGFQLAIAKQGLGENAAHKHVERIFRNANDRHLVKMENYAAERGWKVIDL
jgi:hypothetical protein